MPVNESKKKHQAIEEPGFIRVEIRGNPGKGAIEEASEGFPHTNKVNESKKKKKTLGTTTPPQKTFFFQQLKVRSIIDKPE